MVPNRRAAAAHASAAGAGFRAVARDRRFLIIIAVNIALIIVGYALYSSILPPFAVAHTRAGPAGIGIIKLANTLFIVIAQIPATRVVKRMRRAQAFAAASALWVIALLGVLPATLIHSELGATALLAGVAIVFALGECVHGVVLGPLVADLAPPHLLGRYMSMYALMATGGLALGPAIGGVVLATSPDAVWWGGALVAAVIGAGFLLSGDRIPEPPAVEAPAVEAGVPDTGQGPRAAAQAAN
jgi:MFS family permease